MSHWIKMGFNCKVTSPNFSTDEILVSMRANGFIKVVNQSTDLQCKLPYWILYGDNVEPICPHTNIALKRVTDLYEKRELFPKEKDSSHHRIYSS